MSSLARLFLFMFSFLSIVISEVKPFNNFSFQSIA